MAPLTNIGAKDQIDKKTLAKYAEYAYLGAQYGQVGCPWKDLAKCSSEALTICQDPPVKSYDQMSFFALAPHSTIQCKTSDGWPWGGIFGL